MKAMNIMQIVFESFVILGYFIGLVPFLYMVFPIFWVLPMTIANFVFSNIRKENKTFVFNLVNMIMAVLAVIPLFGYIPRIVGIIMSIFSIVKVSKKL